MIRLDDGTWLGVATIAEDAIRDSVPLATGAMVEVLVTFANELKLTLTGQRSGKAYNVSSTRKRAGASRGSSSRRVHVASAPGEPPAVLYGALRNSVGFSGPTVADGAVHGRVGVGLGTKPGGGEQDPAKTYARRLEFGGVDERGVRILPRPYLEPTRVRMEPKIDAILGDYL